MKGFRRVQQIGLLSTVSLLMTGGLMTAMLPAIAQGTLQFRLPDISAPGNRESGSTRSTSCVAFDDKVIALMPETNYGYTQTGYPSFYFYLPPTTAEQVKFVIRHEMTGELVYEGRFHIAGDSGIAQVSLPNNGLQQPLMTDEVYVWYVSVVCDETDPSADVVTEGFIERIDARVVAPTTPAAALPALYAVEGVWYDALAASAALKQDDSSADWNALLEAVALDQLIPAELLTTEPTP
ncbi:MAG: DUF928 domain-containing protein [Cyanobacteria bacterium P01_H01_bin.162]